MARILRITILVLAGAFASLSGSAANNGVDLDNADTNINDKQSLRNGAKLFMSYCSGCHSISLMRYNRIGADLNMPVADVEKHLMLNSDKIAGLVVSSMPKEGAVRWFGASPPDLSLVARAKGVDWIYTYLRGFYKDESRPFGVNNTVLQNASMPDILWRLKQDKSAKDFDQDVRDITNFLDYVAEPAKLVRIKLGYKVLGFLFILLILTYLLKKEYWKDVEHGKWRAKD